MFFLSIKTILFADDQVIFAELEDDLQRAVFSLKKVADDYGIKLSAEKSKIMAFKGKEAT